MVSEKLGSGSPVSECSEVCGSALSAGTVGEAGIELLSGKLAVVSCWWRAVGLNGVVW